LARVALAGVVAEALARTISAHARPIAWGLFVYQSVAVFISSIATLIRGLFAPTTGASDPFIEVAVTVLVDSITGFGLIDGAREAAEATAFAGRDSGFAGTTKARHTRFACARVEFVNGPVAVVIETVTDLVAGFEHRQAFVSASNTLSRSLGADAVLPREARASQGVDLVVDAVAVVVEFVAFLGFGGAGTYAAQHSLHALGSTDGTNPRLARLAGLVGVDGVFIDDAVAVVVEGIAELVLNGGRFVTDQFPSDADFDPVGADAR